MIYYYGLLFLDVDSWLIRLIWFDGQLLLVVNSSNLLLATLIRGNVVAKFPDPVVYVQFDLRTTAFMFSHSAIIQLSHIINMINLKRILRLRLLNLNSAFFFKFKSVSCEKLSSLFVETRENQERTQEITRKTTKSRNSHQPESWLLFIRE